MSSDRKPPVTQADLTELERNFRRAGTQVERAVIVRWFCRRHNLTVDELNELYRPDPKEVK
jgi:hypothetical protein